MVRPDRCSRCGVECYAVAHHEDYNKPLDVIWFCDQCHVRRHAELNRQRPRQRREIHGAKTNFVERADGDKYISINGFWDGRKNEVILRPEDYIRNRNWPREPYLTFTNAGLAKLPPWMLTKARLKKLSALKVIHTEPRKRSMVKR